MNIGKLLLPLCVASALGNAVGMESLREQSPQKQCIDAVREKDSLGLEQILKANRGIDVNKIYSVNNRSLLVEAVQDDDVEVVLVLLQYGADPNFKINEYDHGPLYYVRSFEMLDLLMKFGLKIDKKASEGCILKAVYYNQPDLLEKIILLNKGINLDKIKTSSEIESLLLGYATEHNFLDIMRILLANGANPLAQGRDGDYALGHIHSMDALNLLIKHGVDINGFALQKRNLLQHLCALYIRSPNRAKEEFILSMLDSYKFSPEVLNDALPYFILSRDFEMIRQLLRMGANPDHKYKFNFFDCSPKNLKGQSLNSIEVLKQVNFILDVNGLGGTSYVSSRELIRKVEVPQLEEEMIEKLLTGHSLPNTSNTESPREQKILPETIRKKTHATDEAREIIWLITIMHKYNIK